MSSYDAIVIGSGLGALAAATAFAGRGKRVLVLERLGNFGGAATIYRHGALTMEASLHETDGDTVFGAHGVFARLGLQDALEPIALNDFYEVRSPLLPQPVRVPHGLDAARETLSEALPLARRALGRYFDELEALYRALHDLEDMSARGPSALIGSVFSGRLFTLFGAAQQTLAQRFDEIFDAHESAKCVLGAPIAYFDDDPAELSYLLYAGVWSRYVEGGSFYFRGGSRALTMAMVKRIKERGGEALPSSEVTEVLLSETGAVRGARYRSHDGQIHEALANTVFAGVAPASLSDMLPDGQQAAFAAQFERFAPSISLFNVSLGLSQPASRFGVSAYSTFIYPDALTRFADFPQACAVFGSEPVGTAPPYVIADYGRLDAGLRKDGEPYLVSICGVDRLHWWTGLDEAQEQARRQRWTEALIGDVERRYPGFAGAITHAEIATARTMKRFLGSPHGEVYGFRPTPKRLFARPPSAATPIPGLWLSSAYTVSGGYSGAMQGGLMAADAALRAR